jgi:hypothetical protein
VIELAPITIQGTTFLEGHHIWKMRSVDGFLLFFYWLNGDIRAERYVQWVRVGGPNTIRVFGMINWPKTGQVVGPGTNSAAWPTYVRQTQSFIAWVNGFGLRVEWVCLADAVALLPEQDDQLQYVTMVREMFEGFLGRNFLEVCNEPWHAFNQVEANKIAPTFGNLHAHLSLGDDRFRIDGDLGYYYYRTYFTLHSGRDPEWMRKGGKDLLEITRLGYSKDPHNPETADMLPIRVPGVDDEPLGIGPEEPGRRSADPKAHAEHHAAAHLMAAGSTIHGDFGQQCRVPEGYEQECVWAIVKAWDAVPAWAQLGQYTRSGLPSCPLKWNNDALRIYAMINGQGDKACAVVIQPTNADDREPADGWRIESRAGPVYNLAR